MLLILSLLSLAFFGIMKVCDYYVATLVPDVLGIAKLCDLHCCFHPRYPGCYEIRSITFHHNTLLSKVVLLADPGEAMDCSSNTVVIHSVSQSVSDPFPQFVYTTKLMRLTQFLKRCVSAAVVKWSGRPAYCA